ncbi:response regulator [Seonamhaeicola aphaedonensis]|uniref:DNA-binding NarL/FixJ family response regulator n=1 Tax=Seonamhaeicola aphaedonensis TaxID=1461338 RepID=A0A3D9HM63_9FLAO|nr:response regulator transcription factor [Seonamhaeicola aphaedonensis]RED50563.1 DNA-binding NarL/FixJ family response regulator [Seonamhaeicola aphaedonensis]
MFKKVLVADDLGSINLGVLTIAKNLGLNNVERVEYCDDAYLRIKKGLLDNDPYDLLITDLSFKEDHRTQKYPSGEDLIKVLRKETPNLKIVVYSIEDRLQKVRRLISQYNINAYVCKGRKGLEELSKAVEEVYEDRFFISEQVSHALSNKTTLDIDDFDVLLLRNLASGKSQEEISLDFKQKNITPSSLSSIEKRLNKLKIQFSASNTIHLVAIGKDIGLI